MQSKNQDKFWDTKLIKNVIIILKNKKVNSSEHFNSIFNKSINCLSKSGIDNEIKIPRITNKMTHRANPQVEKSEDYFRIILFLPFIDDLMSDIEYKFDNFFYLKNAIWMWNVHIEI